MTKNLLLILQEHEEALEESERRMAELQKESEKEAEVNRRQANDLKYLTEREERSRREKEVRRRRRGMRTLRDRGGGGGGGGGGDEMSSFPPGVQSEGEGSGVEHRGGASGAPGVQVQL